MKRTGIKTETTPFTLETTQGGGRPLSGDAKLVYETHKTEESIIANLVLKTD